MVGRRLTIFSPRKALQLRRTGPCARLAACGCLLAATPAFAQIAAPPLDPFSPKPTLWSEPFQPYKPKKFAPAPPPAAAAEQKRPLAPPVSGAGKTGYDSTNRRKRPVAKRKPGQPPVADSTLSPPTSLAPPTAAFAQVPGTPPIGTEIGPIRKRPKPKAHVEPDDPYEQLGIRAGAFDIYPAIELIGGFSSNPAQSSTPQGAALYTAAPELRVQSRWVRHEVNAELRGSYTGYSPDSTPTLSRPYLNGKANGRLDVNEALRLEAGARVLVSTDNPGSPNVQVGLAKLPVFTTFGGNAGVTKAFNRLELTVKGDAERTVYQDSVLTDGTIASNIDRQYNQFGGTTRAAYELSPGVKPFVEVGADQRRHDAAVDINGFQRDSNGLSASVGGVFQLRGTLVGEASIGYARRDYADPRFDRVAGLIGNGSLTWSMNALTTVKFTASSTIAESDIAGVPGIFYRDAGVQIDHAFRRWLIGTLKFGVGLDVYQGSNTDASIICDCVVSVPGSGVADRLDHRYSAALGLTYKFNRTMQLKGEVRQDWLRSNVAGVDYTASTFLLGVRLQR